MDNRPVLSLCIPTNGAVNWVLPTLASIYSQGCSLDDFEVVVVDNGEGSSLEEAIVQYGYQNLTYKKTSEKGFLNLIAALKMGRGEFHKMINHRCLMLPGTLSSMIATVSKYKLQRPVLYFSNGMISGGEEQFFSNFDSFVRSLAVYCSWSAGIGVWHEDVSKLDGISYDEMFPNTSLLFELRQDSEYVIYNNVYMRMQDETGKGGYDFFYTFAAGFMDILSDLRHRGRITPETFLSVKKEMFYYLCEQYYREVVRPTTRSFIIRNVKQSISIYYSESSYLKLLFMARIVIPLKMRLYPVKKMLVRVFSKNH